jgi:cytochrome c553
MRLASFVTMLSLLVGLAQPAAFAADDEVKISLPPASLGQWYKPANKRQVWLHTMFSLRRAMQAVSEYAALEDREHLQAWVVKLVKKYRSIGDMVPEWQDELELEWVDKLVAAAAAMDAATVQRAQRKIAVSCTGCHREYRAVVAMLYRSPDFGKVLVEDSETLEELPYPKFMNGLSYSLNRIKIAFGDGRPDAALDALGQLQTRLADLGEGCAACHKDGGQRDWILGESAEKRFQELQAAISDKRQRDGMMTLGGLAVEVCARCHGIHRTLADMRGFIAPK